MRVMPMVALSAWQWCLPTMQDVVASLEAFLAPLTALLTPEPAMADAKGAQQPNPVLLLLDPLLTDLPFEWLPQLQQATAVVRDFSLHVQHSRTTVAAARQVSLDAKSALPLPVNQKVTIIL